VAIRRDLFVPPTAKCFCDAFKAADSVPALHALRQYAGDNMNVKMRSKAGERGRDSGAHCRRERDAASAPKDEIDKRRGVAGGEKLACGVVAREAQGGIAR